MATEKYLMATRNRAAQPTDKLHAVVERTSQSNVENQSGGKQGQHVAQRSTPPQTSPGTQIIDVPTMARTVLAKLKILAPCHSKPHFPC